ncbi:poly(A) polymerase small subunit VP39 [Choristoneura rosaceana entomopoxvirus 'L']|uniref:Poly(A) polymerase small subunit VP39 n=1 Tax=Choristoneura rosaceana entomopoxvirus 'L' TaxID=1293539 RepID=A0ABM9QKI8_9POXV|nr:poly(A) polymerase small subunit VP39 [Choristoneura rosaceana entomopoxvirus 'L']CCU56046.1 poly(A) polymerase small subunit VP39 [Choristoneura rosaceana entomopoxvirus 'L']
MNFPLYLNNAIFKSNNKINIDKLPLIGSLKNYLMMKLFIEKYVHTQDVTIIIIGSAPGMSITEIIVEYPYINFELYDNKQHAPLLYNFNNVKIHNKLFSLYDINKYIDKNIYVYSDLRTNSKDINLYNDIYNQHKFILHLNPISAMYKVKLPHISTNYKYIKLPIGIDIIQPFAEHTREYRCVQFKNKYRLRYYNIDTAIDYVTKLNYYNNISLLDKTINYKYAKYILKVNNIRHHITRLLYNFNKRKPLNNKRKILL